jgi:hypothetical protein
MAATERLSGIHHSLTGQPRPGTAWHARQGGEGGKPASEEYRRQDQRPEEDLRLRGVDVCRPGPALQRGPVH